MKRKKPKTPFCGKFEKGHSGFRQKNAELLNREYLTVAEVKALREAAKKDGRHRHRNFMIIMLAHRHALHGSELIDLKWEQVDWAHSTIHVNRLKNGKPSVQPIEGDEKRGLRELQRRYPDSDFIFTSERKAPLSRFTINGIIANAGKLAKIPFPVHPHMLRHSKGYSLANAGHDTRQIQDYLGHKNINHTVKYTELAASRMKKLGGD